MVIVMGLFLEGQEERVAGYVDEYSADSYRQRKRSDDEVVKSQE